ncbi:glycoside hydrolase family 15 protein [Streptomyces sp. NPDC059837]|uniref:glycoside hydrolase family 15 protein n=1 Tax=unclassified Streptomyces TaxID=2593676 RepID=UPI0022500807|nr:MULTISPECIES: glycoside hydrolase family 15 protein [unclassified Streptomyces]MCX4405849.1 glycoside hydrolase family 15 protein [Streptomyces sp. NBC_01764]MCX5189628.1 glycoside hydrolase family 15 protein [Streptomyces sp. NBC_00268]
MDRYPPIADHGLVGDLQTAALVSSQGVIDWFAAPRFDSPSIFAALLDHDGGGYFLLAPEHPEGTWRQLYYPDTAVVVTRFMSPDGVGEIVDHMPVQPGPTATDRHSLVRVVRSVRGTVRFILECRPRFDYARAAHELDLTHDRPMQETATFRAPGTTAYLQGGIPLERDGQDVRGAITLNAGEAAVVVFTVCAPDGEAPPPPTTEGITEDLWENIDFWQKWVRTSRYRGRWTDMVHRSAITLKLLTYAPTGAPVAAATMGLPEQVGGERNWDYRYTWVRDGSLSVRALLDLGFVEEATRFTRWLGDRLGDREGPDDEPLQIMYRVDGDPHLTEEILEHFEGYRGSYPVRAGNAASDQLQLDIYGEALYALAEGREVGEQTGYHGWKGLAATLDWLADSWDRPDEGIWETRGGRKDFTYSRVMCWAAFDRGLKLAHEFSRPADTVRWTRARDAILEQVMERGWNDKEQALVQYYGGDVLDASLLLVPRVGFLAPRSPGWLNTLDAMDRVLVSDSLVYRYDPAASPDGLRGSEGTFSLCTFLYVDALARAGRLPQARYAFEKMQTYANHVGLFAEEIGPSGEQLGNFPQAFTHLSLIMAATTLNEALDALHH